MGNIRLKNRDDIMSYFVNGGLHPMLSNITFSKILLPLPPLKEQHQIAVQLDNLMKYCDSLEESILTSRQQNNLLLQQVLREALETYYQNRILTAGCPTWKYLGKWKSNPAALTGTGRKTLSKKKSSSLLYYKPVVKRFPFWSCEV